MECREFPLEVSLGVMRTFVMRGKRRQDKEAALPKESRRSA